MKVSPGWVRKRYDNFSLLKVDNTAEPVLGPNHDSICHTLVNILLASVNSMLLL